MAKNKELISVVIPTYNRERLLEKCVKSLLIQNYSHYEVIIVDDGSTDNTSKMIKKLQKYHKNLRYFKQKNSGHAIARNLGFKKAKGSIIASTDDDCVVEKNWLKKIISTFEKYPEADAVGGSINNPTNSNIAWAHYILDFSAWFPFGDIKKVKDIPTANIAYKKDKIKDLKFVPKYKRLGYKDTLFNHTLSKKKGIILFNPDLKIYHHTWEIKEVTLKRFFEIQKRHGLGFLFWGHTVHGLIGKILIKFKLLNLFCPRLILVFFRCIKNKELLKKFIINFPLIFLGEFQRSMVLFKKRRLKWKFIPFWV